uniref:Uncharacterized protein n=1 Tax=Chrysotila carterae TaxID=13221 RepID=A0A7S4B4W0_CHRCT
MATRARCGDHMLCRQPACDHPTRNNSSRGDDGRIASASGSGTSRSSTREHGKRLSVHRSAYERILGRRREAACLDDPCGESSFTTTCLPSHCFFCPTLHAAVLNDHADCITTILEADADVDELDTSRNTPLALACMLGRTACAQVLLVDFADANYSLGSAPPLFLAAHAGHSECVQLLLRWRADVNAESSTLLDAYGGRAPLWAACYNGELECVKHLCAYDAQRKWRRRVTEPVVSAMDVATSRGHSAIAEFLESTALFTSPLHYVDLLPRQRVRALLREGADIHARAKEDGPTPLQRALRLQQDGAAPPGSAAEMLVQAGGLWSPSTHSLFPASARRFAVQLLLLGALLARSPRFCAQSQAMQDVWLEYIMAHAVRRPASRR